MNVQMLSFDFAAESVKSTPMLLLRILITIALISY